MESLKILIVEDDATQALSLESALLSENYAPVGMARNLHQAISAIKANNPDLAIIDINLANGDNGIELARWIRQEYNMPFIFLTGLKGDKHILQEAIQTFPDQYLYKPYDRVQLYTSIELALHNFTQKNSFLASDKESFLMKEFIYFKDGAAYKKIRLLDIQWVVSDGNYKDIYTAQQKVSARLNMEELFQKIPSTLFLRTHNKYIVGLKHINFAKGVHQDHLFVGEQEIPISRKYREEVFQKLGIE